MKIFIQIMILFTLAYAPVYYVAGARLRRHIGPFFYFAVASTYFVGFFSPLAVLFLGWVLILPMMAPGNRVDVACRYALLLPMMPSINPTVTIGGHFVGQFGANEVLGVGAVIAGLMATRGPKAAPVRGFSSEDAAFGILLLIFGVAAVRFASITDLLRSVLFQLLVLGAPFLVMRRSLRSREDLHVVMACLGVAAACLVPMALYEHHAGWALFDGMGNRYSAGLFIARSATIRGGALRASATFSTPIELGMFLMIGVLALGRTRRFFTSFTGWMGMIGLVLLALLSAQSRGAVIATIAGLLVVMVVQRRYLASGLIVAAALAGYAMLVALARSSMRVAAFMGEGNRVGVYKDYRTLLLDRGMEEAHKHPYLGLPMDQVIAHLRDITQGEGIVDLVNTYLHILLISGAIGLGLFVLAIVLVYAGLWRRGATGASTAALTQSFVVAAFTGMLVQLTGMSFVGRVPAFFVFLLAMARVIGGTKADPEMRRARRRMAAPEALPAPAAAPVPA